MVLRVLFSKTKWWCPVISLSQGLLLINVLGNQILKKRGDREDQERWLQYWSYRWWYLIKRCLQVAIEEGFYMKSSQETGSAKDILLLFRHHCETSPRHLTFEISGSTLILVKICSSSLPPWFSSLLVTTSEATRKYSQVSANLSLSLSSRTNTQAMPWPTSIRRRFQVFKSWLFQLSSVNQVSSLVLTTLVPKQS